MDQTHDSGTLYRRFRPQRFGDMIGQEPVVRVLQNAVVADRVGHAWLFSGPRGTGKTTAARILAHALNCEAPVNGEPCGVCSACQVTDLGSSFDVVEIDAASNSGVDAMRELITSVSLTAYGKFRVYIIDEVHMLSAAASNALLKTLEEPPSHVVFILATTDPHRVMQTIRSRTSPLEFRLVPADELQSYLREVATSAELMLDGEPLSDEIIDAAVRRSGGSVRDALSALEVLAAGGELVLDASAGKLADAILSGDAATTIKAIAEVCRDGGEPRSACEATIAELREMFLGLMGANDLVGPDRIGRRETAQAAGTRRVVRSMELLGEATTRMAAGHDPRVSLEVAALRACMSTAS